MVKRPDEKKELANTKTPENSFTNAELEKLNKDTTTVDAFCRYAQRPKKEIDEKKLSHLFGDFQKICNAYEPEIDFTYNARMYFRNEQNGMPRWTNIVNSAKDVLSMLRKLRDRKEHELAIKQGQGEGKNKEKEEVKARLKLVSKTQETYWDDQRKEKVAEAEFYALWLLATVPNSTVPDTLLWELFKDSGKYSNVYISRLIRGRKDRKTGLKYHFPEIQPFIVSQGGMGYYLKLSVGEIDLTGDPPEEIEDLVKRLKKT